ncbi:MAG TPA: zinc ribbon domain-containing protein [Polyangiaceae bacterium]|nr:zinc ribbon domain-containing protein [Polyangiaceae bacterium]
MPVYEFICDECQHEFEELVFSMDEPVSCPRCGSGGANKVLSRFAFKCGSTFRSSSSKGDSCCGCHPGPSGCAGCRHG